MAWADERVLGRLRESPHDDALRLYAHILGAERVWLTRLEGKDSGGLEVWPALELEACERLAGEMRAGYERYLGGLDEAELARPIAYRNQAGAEFRNSPLDILTQVFMHGSYHRGQIARGLREAGAEPISTDYIVWAREAG
jgi:uncharacterized damage-inducible protein DinB